MYIYKNRIDMYIILYIHIIHIYPINFHTLPSWSPQFCWPRLNVLGNLNSFFLICEPSASGRLQTAPCPAAWSLGLWHSLQTPLQGDGTDGTFMGRRGAWFVTAPSTCSPSQTWQLDVPNFQGNTDLQIGFPLPHLNSSSDISIYKLVFQFPLESRWE
jgi:hypothetical protein